MDADTKKMALRMIPYGIYVLTAKGSDGEIAAQEVSDGSTDSEGDAEDSDDVADPTSEEANGDPTAEAATAG